MDWRIYKIHPAGTALRNGGTQGLLFATAAYLALMLALSGRRLRGAEMLTARWRGAVILTARLRGALGAAAVLLAANLWFVTASRSAQIGLAIMFGVSALALLRGRARIAAIVAVPLVFVAAVYGAPQAKSRFELGWNEFNGVEQSDRLTSIGIRTVMWRLTAQLIAQRPLLGHGTGSFKQEYEKLAGQTQSGWRATPASEPHNQYLSIQVQAGVLGTLAFAIFLLAAARQPGAWPYRVYAVAILASWVATSLASSHFESFNEGHMIATLLGVLLARADRPGDPRSDQPDQPDQPSCAVTAASTSA
jgi:O-antigen ligase